MKRTIIILVSIFVITAIVTGVYFGARKKIQDVLLVTETAGFGYIGKYITATGTIQPVDTVSVGAQVSGVVSKVYTDYNSLVKQGQLLAKVDPSIIQAQVDQAKANLAGTVSNLEFQRNNFNRQKQLFDDAVISKAEYQLELNQYNGSTAAVDNATAQLRLAQMNLSYTNIYSPISGVVLNRNVSAGQTIASSFNAPILFVIARDLTKMQVRAAVDEADIGAVGRGEHVTFTVDAFPEDIFEGTVEEVLLHPNISSNVVTYTTLINVDNTEMKLKPGMTASISIYTEEDSNALLIPSKALSFKPDSLLLKKYTLVRSAENVLSDKKRNLRSKAEPGKGNTVNKSMMRGSVWIKSGDSLIERKVITGINDDSYVKIQKGILPGELVITNVVKGNNKNGNTVQRSPFIPQMQRRPTSNRAQ